MKQTKILAGAVLMALFAGAAQAVPTYCSPNLTNGDGLAVSNMTYNGANADDCYGIVAGNDSQSTINALNLNWGTDWAFLAKDDNPGNALNGTGSFMGIDFSLSATAGTTGNWSLTGTGNVPTTLDLIGVLKGSNQYALYLFDDVAFDGNDGGTWEMTFGNGKKQLAELSHLSLYVRQGNNVVPEPASVFLLGAGLIGLLAVSRRKKA